MRKPPGKTVSSQAVSGENNLCNFRKSQLTAHKRPGLIHVRHIEETDLVGGERLGKYRQPFFPFAVPYNGQPVNVIKMSDTEFGVLPQGAYGPSLKIPELQQDADRLTLFNDLLQPRHKQLIIRLIQLPCTRSVITTE